MRFSFLKKKQPSHKKQPNTPPSELIQVPIAPSPLAIPEILERIFSYVDDFTLRRTVVLVCRLWLQMNQHLILRELVWDTHVAVHNIDKILSKLADTGRLRWFCDWGAPAEESWDKLMRALLHSQNRLKQAHSTPLQRLSVQFKNSLRELELRTSTFKAGNLFDAIPFPPALTSFKFTVQEGSCNFSFGRLLDACPLLEEFHGEVVSNYLFLLGSMVPPDVGEGAQRRFLPLRSLVLRNATFTQSSLEALLQVTPRIQELKLIGLQALSAQGANMATNKYSRADLVQHIQSLPIMLHSFHFSVFNQGVDGSGADELLTPLSPLETGRSLWGDGLTPLMMRKLDEDANVVTTLELYWRYTDECSTSSWLLHRFMCLSRHLLHVRTTNVAFQFEHLDLHRRAPKDRPSDTTSIQTGVWACTNLRTLHLELHGHNQSQLMNPTNTRIVFGYISTVCPRLQDLQLVIPKMCRTRTEVYLNNPSMRLQGGFVLLTRLKYLERLYINFSQPTDVERTHVNWMVPTGRTAEFRKKRKEMMTDSALIKKEQLALKDPAEITRLSLMDKDVIRWRELENTAKRELWRLGLLWEVKKVLEQMDTDDFECWPLLHRVSLNGGFEQSPEACVRNLFM
ncbi:hypothetical protein BGZ96_007271 [Linnemannia gamsii]|uniref:F-box domain-containing protein n=1 Tax=Linnemannia gamsii TaxID=64522 RepID=A0ABQ7KGP8_9FUNG|nr:hypothetical protein BGZ96_007271 [Linnemannia gamsii]